MSNGEQCNMLNYFLKGKTHDIYGAIILVIVAIAIILYSNSVDIKALGVLDLLIGAGIAVDLWAHCFHH